MHAVVRVQVGFDFVALRHSLLQLAVVPGDCSVVHGLVRSQLGSHVLKVLSEFVALMLKIFNQGIAGILKASRIIKKQLAW